MTYLLVCLSVVFGASMVMAAEPAPAQPDSVLTSTNIFLAILSAVGYWFLKPKQPIGPELPPSALTGRPVLDLIVSMVLEHPKVAASPLLQAAVRAEAKAIKSILDEYNVPVVPIPPAPKAS